MRRCASTNSHGRSNMVVVLAGRGRGRAGGTKAHRRTDRGGPRPTDHDKKLAICGVHQPEEKRKLKRGRYLVISATGRILVTSGIIADPLKRIEVPGLRPLTPGFGSFEGAILFSLHVFSPTEERVPAQELSLSDYQAQ
ncbi:hypothetical protein NL676_031721 [Syzygium grande]|nr:hypothetical protein NL676_031721 [Syzygium grande]